MKKYRREGIGKEAVGQRFSLHTGDWQVHQRENNIPGEEFWRKVINKYYRWAVLRTFGKWKKNTKL